MRTSSIQSFHKTENASIPKSTVRGTPTTDPPVATLTQQTPSPLSGPDRLPNAKWPTLPHPPATRRARNSRMAPRGTSIWHGHSFHSLQVPARPPPECNNRHTVTTSGSRSGICHSKRLQGSNNLQCGALPPRLGVNNHLSVLIL